MALLIGLFILVLRLITMTVFQVRSISFGYGILASMVDAIVTGYVFYLWRMQVTLRRREAVAFAKLIQERNEFIRDRLQTLSLRYGEDVAVRKSLYEILESLELKLHCPVCGNSHCEHLRPERKAESKLKLGGSDEAVA